MKPAHNSTRELVERFALALFFCGFGLLILAVFSPLRPMLSREADYLGRIGLTVFLLVLGFALRRAKNHEKFADLVTGLTIMIVAVSLDYIFAIFVLEWLHLSGTTPVGFALIKLNESIIVVVTIIVLTKLSGKDLGSIYLQKGRLRSGLTIGVIAFLVALAISIPLANFQFQAKDVTLSKFLVWLPWLLIAAFSNGAQEELMFRGLFLRKLEPFFKKFGANFLIFFVFSFLHIGVTYNTNQWLFIAAVFPLALAWGAITQKTDSIWGSILFHAGMDIPVFIGIFSNFI